MVEDDEVSISIRETAWSNAFKMYDINLSLETLLKKSRAYKGKKLTKNEYVFTLNT